MKLRHELKHHINYSDMLLLRSRLKHITEKDPYASPDGSYIVKSLYFDNIYDTALREKLDGVNKREKFRIRYYGDDTDFIRLEKKSKINGLCSKESARISADDCGKIIVGDTSFLIDSKSELLREFYAKSKYRLLRPKCIVRYRRECFIYPCGNVRITIDSELCGSYNINEFLSPALSFSPSTNSAILEVKYDEYLPDIISDALKIPNRRVSAFSKYAAVRF